MPRIRLPKDPEPPPQDNPAAAAAYVAALTADLAVIARRNKLDLLGYLLDMARLEAEGSSQSSRPA